MLSIILAGLIAFPSFRLLLFPPRLIPLPPPPPILSTSTPPSTAVEFLATSEIRTEDERELEAQSFADDLAAASSSSSTAFQDPTVEEILQAGTTTERETIEEEGIIEPIPIDQAKVKDYQKLSKVGLPIQTITGEIADSWERWSNALNPTSNISTSFRLKAASYLIPVILLFLFCPETILIQGFTFSLGVVFFGDPMFRLLSKGLDSYVGRGWEKKLEIRQYVIYSSSPSKLAPQILVSH